MKVTVSLARARRIVSGDWSVRAAFLGGHAEARKFFEFEADAGAELEKAAHADEIRQRVARGAVRFKVVLQLAAPGDKIDNPSVAGRAPIRSRRWGR